MINFSRQYFNYRKGSRCPNSGYQLPWESSTGPKHRPSFFHSFSHYSLQIYREHWASSTYTSLIILTLCTAPHSQNASWPFIAVNLKSSVHSKRASKGNAFSHSGVHLQGSNVLFLHQEEMGGGGYLKTNKWSDYSKPVRYQASQREWSFG